jgi:HEAT repeat protein
MTQYRSLRVLIVGVGSVVTFYAAAGAAFPSDDGHEQSRVVAYWIKHFQDPGDVDRRQAAIELGKLGPAARAAIPHLIDAFRHSPPTAVRAQRCGDGGAEIFSNVLVRIGADSIAPLTEALSHPDEDIRGAAAYTLGKFRDRSKSAVPALINLLNDDVPFVRVSAATALWKIDANSESAVPPLVELLEQKTASPHDRSYAAKALGSIGPHANAAVPALIAAIKETSKHHRYPERAALYRQFVDALTKIDPDAAAQAGAK